MVMVLNSFDTMSPWSTMHFRILAEPHLLQELQAEVALCLQVDPGLVAPHGYGQRPQAECSAHILGGGRPHGGAGGRQGHVFHGYPFDLDIVWQRRQEPLHLAVLGLTLGGQDPAQGVWYTVVPLLGRVVSERHRAPVDQVEQGLQPDVL